MKVTKKIGIYTPQTASRIKDGISRDMKLRLYGRGCRKDATNSHHDISWKTAKKVAVYGEFEVKLPSPGWVRDGKALIAKFDGEEVRLKCGEGEVMMSYDQAQNLQNMLRHICDMHRDCEAWVGEIVGMPR